VTAIPGCKKKCPASSRVGGPGRADFGRIGQDTRRRIFYVARMQRPNFPAAGREAGRRRLREALLGAPDRPLPGVARRAGVSERGLYRQARVLLAEGPSGHRRRQRLDAAALDLLDTTRQVIEVALASGYTSPEAFCRAFRRRFGQSPSVWRRSGWELAPRSLGLALAFARHLATGVDPANFARTSRRS